MEKSAAFKVDTIHKFYKRNVRPTLLYTDVYGNATEVYPEVSFEDDHFVAGCFLIFIISIHFDTVIAIRSYSTVNISCDSIPYEILTSMFETIIYI